MRDDRERAVLAAMLRWTGVPVDADVAAEVERRLRQADAVERQRLELLLASLDVPRRRYDS